MNRIRRWLTAIDSTTDFTNWKEDLLSIALCDEFLLLLEFFDCFNLSILKSILKIGHSIPKFNLDVFINTQKLINFLIIKIV